MTTSVLKFGKLILFTIKLASCVKYDSIELKQSKTTHVIHNFVEAELKILLYFL